MRTQLHLHSRTLGLVAVATALSFATGCGSEEATAGAGAPEPPAASGDTSATGKPVSECPSVKAIARDIAFVKRTMAVEEGDVEPEVELQCGYQGAEGAQPTGIFAFFVGEYGDAVQSNFEALMSTMGECFETRTCSGDGEPAEQEFDRWEPGDDRFLGVDVGAPIGELAADPADAELRNAGYAAAVVNGSYVCVIPPFGGGGQGTDPEQLSTFGDDMLRALERVCGR